MDGTRWVRDASGAFEHLLSLSPLLHVKRDQGMGHYNALTRALTLDNSIHSKLIQTSYTIILLPTDTPHTLRPNASSTHIDAYKH